MKTRVRYLLALILMICGGGLLALFMQMTVTVAVSGETRQFNTYARTVGEFLSEVNLTLEEGDVIAQALDAPLADGDTISILRGREIRIWADDEATIIHTTETMPQNLLALAGVALFPEDVLLMNGEPVASNQQIPADGEILLAVERARKITLNGSDGKKYTVYSNAGTLKQALNNTHFQYHPADRFTPPITTTLKGPAVFRWIQAKPVTVNVDGGKRTIWTAAVTVGEALTEYKIALGELDYAVPDLDEELPPNRTVRIVRVVEEFEGVEEPIPYGYLTEGLADVEIDQIILVQAGEPGVLQKGTIIRYEDGVEVSRSEQERVLVEPKDRIIGFGSKIVIRTLNTANGPIEYWRAVTAYATSYSPCRSGADRCYPNTANGTPVKQGVVAVLRSWYNAMAGQYIYIDGYGKAVIADIGGGVPDKHWIDLGYSDDAYVPWYWDVTVYFLTPVPPLDQILWILP